MKEHKHVYPMPSGKLSQKRKELTPRIELAFYEFIRKVFATDALDMKTKQLIIVAVVHVMRYPYHIREPTKAARHEGAAERGFMEAVWIAAEMPADRAFAQSLIAV